MPWSEYRGQMLLDPTVTNLNNGSFGPQPRCVFDGVTALRRRQAEEPMDFWFRQMPPLLWEARRHLAKFLGCRAEHLLFTANVTAAINMIASSIRLAAPGEILVSDQEYLALHWCWERAGQRQGLAVKTFPLPIMAESPDEIVAAFRRAINRQTRLAFFSHVLSPTGMVLPVKAMCAAARERGVMTVVDGAHAAAMVPLDLDDLGCDFYGGNGHKWLLAPLGTGFLYLGPGNENRLQPLQVSWGYHPESRDLDEQDEFGTTPRLRFLEFEASRDVCPWLAVPQAIDFQGGIGWARIRDCNEALVQHVRWRLSAVDGLRLNTPPHPDLHGFLTAFRLPPHINPQKIRQGLWERFRIEAPIVERGEWRAIRVSTHFYNTEEEIDQLAEALQKLLSEQRVA